MRRIPSAANALSPTTLAYLFGALAGFAACASPTAPPTSTATPTPESPASGGSEVTPSSRSISLTGDGHALHLNGAPADPSYTATYPVPDLTGMTITASSFGDLTATCASAGGAVACKSLPFFASVGANGGNVLVYDAYGHAVLSVPASFPSDAGSLPSLPSLPSPPSSPSVPSDAGLFFDAGAGLGSGSAATSCAPSVTASLSGCTLTVGATTCDCSDATCAASAIEACLGSAGVPGLPVGILDDAGGLTGLLPDDGGLPGLGLLDDAGLFGASCSASTIASAKAQFCADVDAWLSAHGMSTTALDCAAIGTLSFPTSLPPASTSGFTCDQITHDAFVKVRSSLATCDPLDYVGWDSSAELQLFEDGACTVW